MYSVTSGLKACNSSYISCLCSYTHTQSHPYFCCFEDLVSGFLLLIS